MGRPSKTLQQLVRDGTFAARRAHHRALLVEPDLSWPELAALQRRYQAAGNEVEQQAIAREFEAAVQETRRQGGGSSRKEELEKLGPRGSFEQLEGFFREYLRHYAGPLAGQPLEFVPFQRAFLQPFWKRTESGARVYNVGLWAIPKGSGKTPIGAGLATHALVSADDKAEVYSIAGSKDQAGIAHRYARGWADDSDLAAWLRAGNQINCADNGGFYKVLSSDGRLAQGVNPSAGIIDEWWLFATQRERETYTALAEALHKRRGESWLLAITTAGFDKHTQLGETYESAVKHPGLKMYRDFAALQRGEQTDASPCLLVLRDEDSGFLMHWYGASADPALDIEDPALVRACNPAPWIDTDELLRGLRRHDTNEQAWRRLHLNQWTSAKDAWIPSERWARLKDESATIPQGVRIYAGGDAASRRDTTAVGWAYRREDGRVVVSARVWSAREEVAAHDYSSARTGWVDNEAAEEFIAERLAQDFRLQEFVFDPRYFLSEGRRLAAAGITAAPIEQASAEMGEAWALFYKAFIEGTIVHDGDPVLARHVTSATARLTERGTWKVSKLKANEPIDALVAVVLAHWRVLRGGGTTTPYEEHDLMVL